MSFFDFRLWVQPDLLYNTTLARPVSLFLYSFIHDNHYHLYLPRLSPPSFSSFFDVTLDNQDRLTNFMKKSVCCWVGSADGYSSKRLITVSWAVSIVLVFIAFIIACASAAKMHVTQSDRIVAFTALWTVLLLVTITIAGTAILKRVSFLFFYCFYF